MNAKTGSSIGFFCSLAFLFIIIQTISGPLHLNFGIILLANFINICIAEMHYNAELRMI